MKAIFTVYKGNMLNLCLGQWFWGQYYTPTGFQIFSYPIQLSARELSCLCRPHLTRLGVRDHRITELGSVAVRHIVFFANVYSLCARLTYACASVFINITFMKSLPPASSASLGRGGAQGDPESHTQRNALKQLRGPRLNFKTTPPPNIWRWAVFCFLFCVSMYERTLTFFLTILEVAQRREEDRAHPLPSPPSLPEPAKQAGPTVPPRVR